MTDIADIAVVPAPETDPVAELRAWADRAWAVMEESGQSGKGYELTMTFQLPHVDDGDLRSYALRMAVADLVMEAGARNVGSRLIALGSLQEP